MANKNNRENQTINKASVLTTTENSRIDIDLLSKNKFYKLLFETSNDSILLMDKDKFLDCNNKAIDVYQGNTKEDILNTTPWELSPKYQADGSKSKKVAQQFISAVLNVVVMVRIQINNTVY